MMKISRRGAAALGVAALVAAGIPATTRIRSLPGPMKHARFPGTEVYLGVRNERGEPVSFVAEILNPDPANMRVKVRINKNQPIMAANTALLEFSHKKDGLMIEMVRVQNAGVVNGHLTFDVDLKGRYGNAVELSERTRRELGRA